MTQFDLSLDELRQYRPPRVEPADFDAFWRDTIAASRRAAAVPRFALADSPLQTVVTYDVTFGGYLGQPIRAWLQLPAGAKGPLPAIVEYVGYGGGRGLPTEWLLWASAGYAHLVMDTRGQGGTWRGGDTDDVEPAGTGPSHPGVMTKGILDPSTYYYRRLMTDAVLAVDVARRHPLVDPARVVVAGTSQGGGLALAAAAFAEPQAALIDVPFLCHVRRALEVTDAAPYSEVKQYLRVHRDAVEQVFRTLAYVDGRAFAARCTAPALFAAGLEDEITPPSTVFAAFNEYAGPKEIRVWPYNGHDAGTQQHELEKLAFLRSLGLAPGGT